MPLPHETLRRSEDVADSLNRMFSDLTGRIAAMRFRFVVFLLALTGLAVATFGLYLHGEQVEADIARNGIVLPATVPLKSGDAFRVRSPDISGNLVAIYEFLNGTSVKAVIPEAAVRDGRAYLANTDGAVAVRLVARNECHLVITMMAEDTHDLKLDAIQAGGFVSCYPPP